ncbi:MAG: cobalamin-dependent protein [Magnetococcales bacterium]|nr:cobalamin-dependent protein [Magnetococcales bacterium]
MNAKIILINPNTRWHGKFWHEIPYGICILKAALAKHFHVTIVDANFQNMDEEDLAEILRREAPDCIGITCMSMEYHDVFLRTAKVAKETLPNSVVVVGGIYPTLMPERLVDAPGIDYVIMGEGEYRFPEFLTQILSNKKRPVNMDGLAYMENGKAVIHPITYYIHELDQLPFPDYSDIDYAAYASQATKYVYYSYPRRWPFARTISSRGCPFKCIYCSSRAINGKEIRYRSAESVLTEIDWLVETYGIKELLFYDDNLALNRNRFEQLLRGLIDRNYDLIWKSTNIAVYALDDEILELMRKSGCYQLAMAIESGVWETLRGMKKPIKSLDQVRAVVHKAKELGFECAGMFIIGLPMESWENIRQTIHFAEELQLDYCTFNIATPLPKTELLDICQRDGLLPKDFGFDGNSFYGFGHANITTDAFIPQELQILRAFEWDRINFNNSDKRERVALMNGITMEELEQWRINTRRSILASLS